MVGILIVAHMPFASALNNCLKHIYGHALDRVVAIDIESDIEEAQNFHLLQNKLNQVCGKNGTLILCDLAHATPANIAIKLANSSLIKIISGVNLPLLLKAISCRTMPLDELVQRVLSGGVDGIHLLEAKGKASPIKPT